MPRINWTDREFEICLYFYLTHDVNIAKNNPELIELSKRLNIISPQERTLDSRYLRFMNYRYVDPKQNGHGMKGGATLCKIYWDKYINNLDKLKKIYDDFIEETNNYDLSSIKLKESENDEWSEQEDYLCLYLLHENKNLEDETYINELVDRSNKITNNNRKTNDVINRVNKLKSVMKFENNNNFIDEQNLINSYNEMKKDVKGFINDIIDKIDENDIDELIEINEELEKIYELNIKHIDNKDAFIESLVKLRNPSFQRNFKNSLICEFNNKCVVCGLNNLKKHGILIASHIMPYSMCTNKVDMINHNNGLLLCPNHDALFDKKIISFDNYGRILINHKITKEMYRLLNINEDIVLPAESMTIERKKYMEFHRNLFKEIDKNEQ